MKQRIFRSTGILIAVAVLFTFLLTSVVYYQDYSKEIKSGVQVEAEYLKKVLEETGDSYLTQDIGNLTQNRLTLIDMDGTVLFDSIEEPADMENHSDRPEFIEARKTGTGIENRLSATLNENTYYYALLLKNGEVIRVACTSRSIFATLTSSFTMIILILIIVLSLALVVIRYRSIKLIEPINQIDLEHPLENDVYEELAPLLRRLDIQNNQIEEQLRQIKQNHEEYLAITENMKDGMIITNKSVVLGINKAATELFGVDVKDCLHKNILTVSRNVIIKESLDMAIAGHSTEKILEMNGRVLQILANPVSIEAGHSGAVLLILDITEKQQAEAMRREFSANVSHELKTPLMSISGYAELMMNRMVKDTDIPEFSSRIYDEANRLRTLVEDIIKLSRLDEADGQLAFETVDLLSITQDVSSCLQLQAKKRDIQMTIEGKKTEMFGVRQVLYEMIFNLCDNAIKYNKDHGQIYIKISSTRSTITWKIMDTGIGIEKEHQDRIFERFYRVDKSHSRETGGTGLGLSIVKHGAMLHKGNIKVESEIGEGTKISIEFQKNSENQ